MLNVLHGRQQWLADVCIERVLPERRPPRPTTANGDAPKGNENRELENGNDEDGNGNSEIGNSQIEGVNDAKLKIHGITHGRTGSTTLGPMLSVMDDPAIIRTGPLRVLPHMEQHGSNASNPITSQPAAEPYFTAYAGPIALNPVPSSRPPVERQNARNPTTSAPPAEPYYTPQIGYITVEPLPPRETYPARTGLTRVTPAEALPDLWDCK
jgi:hypothetical protein